MLLNRYDTKIITVIALINVYYNLKFERAVIHWSQDTIF